MRWLRRYRHALLPQALLLLVLVGLLVGQILAKIQENSLRVLLFADLTRQLERQADSERRQFDEYVQSHPQAAGLLVAQSYFREYVNNWPAAAPPVALDVYQPPPWLPPTAVLRGFFPARHALLIDAAGRTREVYHSLPEPLPASLHEPSSRLQQLSHTQAYLTEAEGRLYLLAAHTYSENGAVLATLMLVSPLNDDFLVKARLARDSAGGALVVVGGEPSRVVASSQPQRVVSGSLVASLSGYWRSPGSRLEYAAADLALELVSLVPQQDAYRAAVGVLELSRDQRRWLVWSLSGGCALVLVWVVLRLQRVTRQVRRFAEESLGLGGEELGDGDEIQTLERVFAHLRDCVAATVRQAEAIAAGDYAQAERLGDHHAHRDSLSHTFHQMSHTLRRQAAQLREANQSLLRLNQRLEQRVRERTQALEQTNRELQHTLDSLQNTQRHLVESKKMAALGTLVAGVAHEINTPIGVSITAISALGDKLTQMSARLTRGPLPPEELRQFVAGVNQTTQVVMPSLMRAAELVRNFKQVAADQEQSRQASHWFRVGEAIARILHRLEPALAGRAVETVVECDPDLEIYAHPVQFAQVLTHLVMNAVQHAFAEGQPGTVTLSVRAGEGETEVCCRDNGRGIDPAYLERIFEPFFTTARGHGGRGLGLAVAYNTVVQNLRGQIRCHSRPGQGSAFCFSIPHPD